MIPLPNIPGETAKDYRARLGAYTVKTKIKRCPHCQCLIRLVAIPGSGVVWAHPPGRKARCDTARAKRASKTVTPITPRNAGNGQD